MAGGFPRRFGSYVLLKPLARGGMGELDLAVTGGHGMEKLCVIKRVLPHLLMADNVQRFREEATMMMRLSHGNLVGVLDAGREQGQFYLAMDFVEGKDLLATWNQCASRRVAFPVEIAAYVIKELARGLGYAHGYRDLRLVHRDISPANVLLSYSGEVKLTDFGLATSKLKGQQTAPGIIYGKLAYLAPEQARGQPLDGRTDLYAAGILLWEMLTGQQLFPSQVPDPPPPPGPGHRNSALDALDRVRNPVVAPPSSLTARVPTDLNDIVLRALAIEPAHRYQTGEQLRSDLASFLARHAPATDAATLASFMALLFQEQIEHERSDRDDLLAEASALLSGPHGNNAAAPDKPGPPPPDDTRAILTPGLPRHELRLADPAHWDSLPGARNLGGDAAPAKPRPPDHTPPGATTVQRRRLPGDRRGRLAHAQAGEERLDGAHGLNGHSGHPPAPTPIEPPAELLFGDARDSQNPQPEPRGADEDQRVGTTIAGRYYLRRLCGAGAMGRVYEGHHVEIGRRVAIKILHSNFRNTPDVVERFRREARAASRIGHPNIVDVTDAGTTPDGAFFFVMEYLDGVDLEHVIAREGALPVERALLIAAQVCRALAGAHTAGIIHRDLKPANVMLVRHRDEEDFVKVLDFGISKQSQLDLDPRGKDVGLTNPDAAVGTPIYMAPEQVAGYPADGRTDVYAVGELLFEMLTGTAPCSGNDIIAVFNKKANEDPPPVRSLRQEVPEAIERMLVRAMSRQPADRHATMAEIKDEIMGCLAGVDDAPGVVESPRPRFTDVKASITGRVWQPPSRALLITALGLVVGLGLASMAVLWRTDVKAPPGRTATTATKVVAAALPRASASVGTSRTAGASTGGAAPALALERALAPPIVERATAAPPPSAARDPAPLPTRRAGLASRGQTPPSPLPKPQSRGSTPAPAATPADSLTRGRTAFAKGHFPEAVRLGRAAIALGEAVGGHLLLGDAFYRMERFGDAVIEYDAVLKLAPGNERARRGRDLATRRASR